MQMELAHRDGVLIPKQKAEPGGRSVPDTCDYESQSRLGPTGRADERGCS